MNLEEGLIKASDNILLIADGNLGVSVAACLLKANHRVYLCTENPVFFREGLKQYQEVADKDFRFLSVDTLEEDSSAGHYPLIIAITPEDAAVKQALLKKLEGLVGSDVIIAINTESIDLGELQAVAERPGRILGLNWTEPAHTTYFLEIISTEANGDLAKGVAELAERFWSKDPYIVENSGIRARFLSAMAREAFFLVQNGYASVEDVDRACRNDAGYYLPFSGNCRYMDLMGTYAYGMVMRDLNPDLAKDKELPQFIEKILLEGGLGMKNRKGFYNYTEEEVADWKNKMNVFSHQIQTIIEKYPFNYKK